MADRTYPCYWQERDSTEQWHWFYFGEDGAEIARSSESYRDRVECIHAIQLMKNSSTSEIFYSE